LSGGGKQADTKAPWGGGRENREQELFYNRVFSVKKKGRIMERREEKEGRTERRKDRSEESRRLALARFSSKERRENTKCPR